MDKVKIYRQMIKQVLDEFVGYVSGSPSEVETFVVSDDTQNTYTVFDLGWEGERRICGMPVLIRLVNGKAWIEADNTDYNFVERLLEVGLTREDVVLAFHHPRLRPYTEFAVA